jgi:NADPH:quinone reductase-like Zn-dependent oxidoreductase
MKRRYKYLSIALISVALLLAALAVAISHDSACAPAPALPDGTLRMNAIVYRCYGAPEVLKLEQVARPTVADGRMLIRVHAASVNPLDWHYLRGVPYIMRADSGLGAPGFPRLGVDFAGTVVEVGNNVTRFKPGDAVFGGRRGAFAEYLVMAEDGAVAMKPSNMSFEQAAAVPIAAVTALQALRDKGAVKAGHKVLINGASGGVGTFAVQIAKSMGADVTGVCSTRNVELVRSLGADRVIDYTREDYASGGQRYDVILDMVGNRSLRENRRALKPGGTLVIVGGPSEGRWIGAMSGPIKAAMLAPFVDEQLLFYIAELNQQDLTTLGNLLREGSIKPVIDRHYSLAEVPAAISYIEQGRARGKVIIDIAPRS